MAVNKVGINFFYLPKKRLALETLVFCGKEVAFVNLSFFDNGATFPYLPVLADNFFFGAYPFACFIKENAAAWIVKIAKNEALNVKKVRMREQYVDERENPALFGVYEPDTYGELTDMAKRLLPDDEFSILMLVSVCGYKRKEIGKMLDMPIPTVTWKYQNALSKMRRALEKEGY